MAGRVLLDGKPVIKAGQAVKAGAAITLTQPDRYVSRGGEKLDGALNDLKLDPHGAVCLDVGASTGGFTDCLLQKGAKRVYAVDVGTHQLADSLRTDPRVLSFEKTHILDFKLNDSPPVQGGGGGRATSPHPPLPLDGGGISIVTIDVSFISLKKVLPKIKELAAAGADVLAMVKPQFEVGAKFLKKGVVRDESVQKRAVEEIIAFAKGLDFEYVSQAPSRLKGPKGNQEYFIHLKKK